jgi:hypothetical protein
LVSEILTHTEIWELWQQDYDHDDK